MTAADFPGVADGNALPRAKFPGGEYTFLFPLTGAPVLLVWLDDGADAFAWQRCPYRNSATTLVYQRSTGWQAKC